MGKLLFRLVILVVVLLAGAVAWLAFNANSLVAKHRGDIETALSETLKTKVSFESITASVFPKTSLNLQRLDIGGGVKLDGVALRISPLALLTGTIKINELSIDDPAVTLEQTRSGFVVEGLPAPASPGLGDTKPAQPPANAATTEKAAPATGTSPVSVALDSFALRNGSVKIEMLPPGKAVSITELNVSSGLAVSGSSVALAALKSSVEVNGIGVGANASRIALDTASKGIKTDGLQLNTPAGAIEVGLNFTDAENGEGTVTTKTPLSLAKIGSLVSEFAPTLTNLTGAVGLDLSAKSSGNSAHSEYSHGGTISLSGLGVSVPNFDVTGVTGNLKVGGGSADKTISTDDLKLELNGAPLKIAMTAELGKDSGKASLSRLNVDGFGGSATAQAVAATSGTGGLQLQFNAQKISLNSALAVLKNPALNQIDGNLERAAVDITTVQGAEMLSRLNGKASFDVRDGTLRGINLLGPVIQAVRALPVLTGEGSVPPASSAAANSPDTAFKSVSGSFIINQGVAQTNDLLVLSPLFELKGAGTLSTAGAIALKTSILLEPGLSAALAGKHGKKILDKDGRLEVPLAISGTPANISVTPDVNRLLETAAGKALEEGAAKLLGKALGGGKKGGIFGF
jgi:hypothetical protein